MGSYKLYFAQSGFEPPSSHSVSHRIGNFFKKEGKKIQEKAEHLYNMVLCLEFCSESSRVFTVWGREAISTVLRHRLGKEGAVLHLATSAGENCQ
jgi:hypothetical protein